MTECKGCAERDATIAKLTNALLETRYLWCQNDTLSRACTPIHDALDAALAEQPSPQPDPRGATIAELRAELQDAYTRAQNAVEDAERETGERDATIARLTGDVDFITEIVRQADDEFKRVGGSSRHWVRDCYFPLLRAALAEQPL